MLVFGFPIFLILLTSCIVTLTFYIDVPLSLLHQQMFSSMDSFTLMAVPFFIFAGEVMGQGGISQRIVNWVMSLIGGVRGGLGLTTVGTCSVFGAISGSGPATVAAVGRLMHKPLRDNGYDETFTAGLLVTSGGIAALIPPSVALILYGMSAEQAINLLFIAGFLPGLLLAFLMGLYVYFTAVRRGLGSLQAFHWQRVVAATRDGIWALMMPIIILGGIYTGIFSPTESAGAASVYAVLVTRYVYKSVTWKRIWEIAGDAMYFAGQVFIIVAAAAIYSWILTVSGIPATLVEVFNSLDVSPWMGLLIINIFLLIVGALVDPASAILVLTPLLVPIAQHLGIDLIHFGVIMAVNIEIGLFTPPFGVNIFVAQAMFNTPLKVIYRGLVPFLFVNLIVLTIVTYWPDLSLFLVRLTGF
ncbi:MAG: TRAP transporter large permease [Burkholderiaceae bacterium]